MSSQKLRINWILPGANLSGGTKSNRLIAEAMVRRGHDVTIAYADRGPPWPSPLRPRRFFRHARTVLERLIAGKNHHLLASQARLLPVPKRCVEESDVPDADFTIATWWKTAEWIEPWSERKGRKCFFVRDHVLEGRPIERVRAAYRLPFQKFLISTWLRDVMEQEYGDSDAVLVPNGVDWSQFGCESRTMGAPPTVGTLYGSNPLKGAETAFSAIRAVQARIPSLRVVCFGSQRLRSHHTVPANFEFLYKPPQVEISELYRKVDCWVVPSKTEGFGMPGLEAAACGCPLVSTRCGGPEDYVRPGKNGFLVGVDDADEMAARIFDVLSLDPASWSRMSQASHEIARGFSWDRSAQILEEALVARLSESASS